MSILRRSLVLAFLVAGIIGGVHIVGAGSSADACNPRYQNC